jgi:GNAT superfamily N-acetyltransferase
MELLLASLVTCAGTAFDSVLEKMRVPATALNVVADADRSETPPRVYTAVTLEFQVASDAPDDRLLHAIGVAERVCSASVMIAKAAPISTRLVSIRPIPAAATRPLRQRILRPHQSIDDLASEEDPAAVWFGAVRDDEVIGTASIGSESSPDEPAAHPFRLRAMATAEDARGRGLGRVILDAAIARTRQDGGDLLWCSARTPAAGFYREAGFVETSALYEVPHIGPHVRMLVRL